MLRLDLLLQPDAGRYRIRYPARHATNAVPFLSAAGVHIHSNHFDLSVPVEDSKQHSRLRPVHHHVERSGRRQ